LKLVWANSSQDPILKIANPQRAGGVAQVVEWCLPSNHEALSANPRTAKKKKRKREKNATEVSPFPSYVGKGPPATRKSHTGWQVKPQVIHSSLLWGR
jgi:phosphoenolpyruvate synthase/pyruvate phosphate dikinase